MDFGYLPSDKNVSGRAASVAKDLRQELFSEGTLAFYEQIQSGTYDPSRGKLTTYLYPHIKGAMHHWLEKYQNEETHIVSISDLAAEGEIDRLIEYADQQSTPVDWIVYQKICLELLQELFDKLSDKDKSILGHSFGVYGYKKYTLDELGLQEMLTADGVVKAKKVALRHLQKLYKDSKLQLWRSAHLILFRST